MYSLKSKLELWGVTGAGQNEMEAVNMCVYEQTTVCAADEVYN